MTKTAEIHSKLLELVGQLRDHKGSESDVEKIGAGLEAVIRQLEPTIESQDKLLKELKNMLDYIQKTKADLAGLTDTGEDNGHISLASEELDAVVKTTEDAANRIMDGADKVQEGLSGLDVEIPESVQTAIHDIYEACNFLDLTGQRIRKVMQTLEYLEDRLGKLTGNTSGSGKRELGKLGKDERPDADLMNGPGKLGETPTQDDIDALFNSLD